MSLKYSFIFLRQIEEESRACKGLVVIMYSKCRNSYLNSISGMGLRKCTAPQALQFEGGTHIVASGALATLSGEAASNPPFLFRVGRDCAMQQVNVLNACSWDGDTWKRQDWLKVLTICRRQDRAQPSRQACGAGAGL